MSPRFSMNYRNKDLVLGILAGKVLEPTDIAQSEKALLSVNEGSLYFPIFHRNVEVGGVFIGLGQVIVDAIVETRRGAIGHSREFLWNGSLLLLSEDGNWSPPETTPIKDKHLKAYLLESVDEAQERAQGIFNRFLENNRNWFDEIFIQRLRGWVAQIFDRQRGKCILIASGDRIVLKIADWKVVLSGNKLIEKDGRKKVVVAGRGGHVIRLG
ncbi:MAG: hypothetical protein ACFE8O_09335 [Candidatus Hermodarchaeota archaeon]